MTTTGQPGERPLVSIVIPAWNKWDYTVRCLRSLAEHTSGVAHEIIVVDNASTDETATALPAWPGVRVHRNEQNLGSSKACNQGAALARGEHLLFLNNDTEALAGWLPPLLAALEAAADVGMVGAKLLFPDGTLQHAGVAVAYAGPLPILPFHLSYRKPAASSTQSLDLSAVTAACVLVRGDLFRRLGGFDEAYRNGYEDMDLCFKVREAGMRVRYEPASALIHHESVSEGRFLATSANEDLLNRRWMGRFTAFDVDRRKTRPPRPPPEARAPLSVVVPTLDALRCIAVCLEDLADQLGPADEIVVADAGSADCTLRFVALFAGEHPGLVKVVTSPPAEGLVGAVRAGLAATTRDLCFLVPPALRMPPAFSAQIAGLLAKRGRPAIACIPVKGAGFFAAGPTGPLRTLGGAAAQALLQDDAAGLQAAAQHVSPVELMVAGAG